MIEGVCLTTIIVLNTKWHITSQLNDIIATNNDVFTNDVCM